MTRILVADDSATIRKIVRASLHGLGSATFAEAASVLEAIEQLAISPV
jgi:two-component system chemotaxis response regulator CheY